MEQLLLLLAILPLSVHHLSKRFNLDNKWLFTGLSIGMVIAPVSLCLFKWAYVPIVGKLLGGIGLIVNLIHGPIGYFFTISLGMQEPGALISTSHLLMTNIANGVIWALVYGVMGHHIDVKWSHADERDVVHVHGATAAL